MKQSRRARSRDAESASTPAPSYEAHPRGSDIAPPDYEDALHDAVVNTEVSNIQVCTYLHVAQLEAFGKGPPLVRSLLQQCYGC